jgi:hypothetical protein
MLEGFNIIFYLCRMENDIPLKISLSITLLDTIAPGVENKKYNNGFSLFNYMTTHQIKVEPPTISLNTMNVDDKQNAPAIELTGTTKTQYTITKSGNVIGYIHPNSKVVATTSNGFFSEALLKGPMMPTPFSINEDPTTAPVNTTTPVAASTASVNTTPDPGSEYPIRPLNIEFIKNNLLSKNITTQLFQLQLINPSNISKEMRLLNMMQRLNIVFEPSKIKNTDITIKNTIYNDDFDLQTLTGTINIDINLKQKNKIIGNFKKGSIVSLQIDNKNYSKSQAVLSDKDFTPVYTIIPSMGDLLSIKPPLKVIDREISNLITNNNIETIPPTLTINDLNYLNNLNNAKTGTTKSHITVTRDKLPVGIYEAGSEIMLLNNSDGPDIVFVAHIDNRWTTPEQALKESAFPGGPKRKNPKNARFPTASKVRGGKSKRRRSRKHKKTHRKRR